MRRAYIVGGHITRFLGARHPDFIHKKHPDFGKRSNPTLEAYISEAVNGALAGVDATLVDKCWIGNFAGELFSSQGHLGAAVVGANAALMHKPSMRVEGACASGGLAFACALDSIRAGSDVALVVGAEVQTTASARQGGDYLARASHYARERSLDDFVFPAIFARRVKAYTEAYGLETAALGAVAAKAYAGANRNALAHMHHVQMDTQTASVASERNPTFLGNEELRPYLRMADCSQVSDGGAALLLVSEEGLSKLGKRKEDAVEVVGFEQATSSLYEDADPLRLVTVETAAARAYGAVGVRAADVGVAEVHDCFTITELLMYEALGWAAHGEGASLLGTARAQSVNTGGGLVGFGHPVGATGVKQLIEVWRQMKGRCGDYQLAGAPPALGLCANMGGDDKTVCLTLLKNL